MHLALLTLSLTLVLLISDFRLLVPRVFGRKRNLLAGITGRNFMEEGKNKLSNLNY